MNLKRALYVVEDAETAQFRYQVLNVVQALKKSEKWRAEYLLGKELSSADLDGLELLIISRQAAKGKTILSLIKKAQEKGIRVLFDLDDLIFDYKDLPVLMSSTNSKNICYWMGYFWGIRRIAKKVDGFIATNEFLGKKLKRTFKKPFAVIPNSLNSVQVGIADKVLENKEHDGFKIGYFSGSPTHSKDFRMVKPSILKFLNTYKDAKLVLVGYMELSLEMEKMVEEKKVEARELVDYEELMRLMAEVDVNIAPLQVNDFTNCKSELKFFEAAVVETTTIASPTYTFSRAITDGENGFLAEPGEWYDKLEYLYKNPSENIKIAKAARKYALENYYGKKFLKEVEEAYDSFMV